MVERLFLAVPRGCLLFVIVVFPDHTHLLFFKIDKNRKPGEFEECSKLLSEEEGGVTCMSSILGELTGKMNSL